MSFLSVYDMLTDNSVFPLSYFVVIVLCQSAECSGGSYRYYYTDNLC